MYEQITAFLPKLKEQPQGEWIIDHVNDGTPEHPKQFPFVGYSRAVHEFEDTVYQFVDDHKEMQLTNYSGILEKVNVKWGLDSMKNADVSSYDGTTVMALIVGAMRAERFCDGALLDFLESGSVQRWLARLIEIDNTK